MRSKLKLFIVFGLIAHGLSGYQYQTKPDSVSEGHAISISQNTVISGRKNLPFWLVSNNSSRLEDGDYLGLWTNININNAALTRDRPDYFYGLEGNAFAGSSLGLQLTQAYAGIRIKSFDFHFGLREEFFGVNDSTLSIGNLFYGNNARPVPKFVIKTADWTKVPFMGNFLSFRAYWAHGWFEEDRYQSKSLLHQKYLYLRTQFFKKRVEIVAGLHHSAQWAGSNREKNTTQPSSFADFTRIIFASSGNDNALPTDQINALGNHLGSYDLSTSIRFGKFTVRNYWQFLWEDKSGLTPFNWRDGLFGLSIKATDKTRLVHGINVEIIRTTSQDATKYDKDGNKFLEPDDFFNNSVYRSGWTYQQRGIASPIFLILNPKAFSASIVKNVVNGYNMSIEGTYKKVSYRTSFRHFSNRGTIFERFNPSLKLSSIITDFHMPVKNGRLGLTGVLQWGNYPGRNAGLIFSYSRDLIF